MSHNLYVEIKGQGLPILCLHGHPGSSNCLSVFTNHLSKNWQTITPDLLGYGKSRSGRIEQMSDHLWELEALLDQQQVKHCLILGWSLGGILAIELALRNPQRYGGLILIATSAHPWGSHPAVTWQDSLYTGIAGILNYLKPGWRWNIETFGQRSLFRYLLGQHTAKAYQYLATEGTPAYWQTSQSASKALAKSLKAGYNRLEDLQRLELPCLMLAGEQDRHITAQSSQETAQNLPNCRWQCYPQTAHLFPWEIPNLVLQDIDQWLDFCQLSLDR